MTLPPAVSALIRASVIVRDLERATRFYRTLGLNEVYFEGVLEHPSASSILGFAKTGPVSVRILKRPGPNYGMMGLFHLDDALGAEVTAPGTGAARVGEIALVFYVPDLDPVLEALRACGATWSPEPEVFQMEHRAQREVCLRDPDGILINLVETDPAQQERTWPELAQQAA